MASFGGGPTASFARLSQQQYASSSGTAQPSSSSKSSAISLATLAKASEVLNGIFEKDAQMVPELRDTLAGGCIFILFFHEL
jgi:hypothetical protein